MSKLFNDTRIYLKDSDHVRLANVRARIVRESNPREPADNEDLVFEKADGKVPHDAIYSWNFAPMDAVFYTTAKRCKRMVSEDPSYWTLPKLRKFAEIEERLYRDWCDGHVYGYIIEKWDENQRKWQTISSTYGMYGAKSLLDNLAEDTDGVTIPVCIDEEEMKYEFDNTEKKVNEFDGNTPS